ncbi:T9SS type A sorting domain-containing protein [Flavobacterium jejuense]|uniref:T9SS type A sorting domain-containing protein n=1 Tax=Flavobacterium jejuense TaxID=1544455 RepID=A0ABX0IS77_9FLAO|nr:FG-GAP-like repeat-containing protein [Flavobacterium jejuense]NHN24971.1 T9SS type A sorting domain-containing protein [Flavobacterium jejuense]
MKKNYLLSVLLALILLLSASIYSQNIVSTNPTMNAINVPVNANLSISFDALITPAVFNSATIVVTGSQTGRVFGTFLGIYSSVIIFNPQQDFKPGEIISITLSTSTNRAVASFTTAVSTNSAGTFDYGQNIITTNASDAFTVFSADLDGDGDLDVLSASIDDNKIAWYANDGSGNFGSQQIITTSVDEAWEVYAADLDNDGDMDVISASAGDDRIAWYENDGSGNFGSQQTITTHANLVRRIHVSDMDGDGDLDVISTSINTGHIYWYKNNSNGSSWTEEIVSSTEATGSAVNTTDFDNDGDIDVLASSNGNINWYKNNGFGNFTTAQNIATVSNSVFGLYAKDLDLDGYQDVLAAINGIGIVWYKNNGDGTFSSQQVIATSALVHYAYAVHATDLDGDGDMDVLSASSNDDKVAWYENDGNGNFGTQQIITTSADAVRNIYVADLDGDGDMDVLSASGYDNKIAWYKNGSTTLNLNDNELNNELSIYPNPTNNQINIKVKNGLAIQKIAIYDLTGRIIKEQNIEHNLELIHIDMLPLKQANYSIKITTDKGILTKKIIKM